MCTSTVKVIGKIDIIPSISNIIAENRRHRLHCEECNNSISSYFDFNIVDIAVGKYIEKKYVCTSCFNGVYGMDS